MSDFQETMGRLQDMIIRSNELVEIKREAGKKAFEQGRKQGAVDALNSVEFRQLLLQAKVTELESLHKLINNDLNYGLLLIRKQINDLIKKRLGELK